MTKTRHLKHLKKLDKILEDLQKEGARQNIELIKEISQLAERIDNKEFD